MFENLRFNAGETSKDDATRGAFADQLAALAGLYVSDGFGVLHRKQASVYDVALRLPHAAGYLVRAEVAALRRLTADIRRPYVVVLGGAKVADKFDAIGSLISVADRILVGGGHGLPSSPPRASTRPTCWGSAARSSSGSGAAPTTCHRRRSTRPAGLRSPPIPATRRCRPRPGPGTYHRAMVSSR
jgi:Phosphoglycerate kinase